MKGVKIEKFSKVVLFWMVAVVAILIALGYFIPSWETIRYISPVFVFGIALFVFVEVKYFDGFKKKDIWRMFGVIVAAVAMIGVILEIIPGMPQIVVLDVVKGLFAALLALYFIVEGLR